MVSLMTALWFAFLEAPDRVSVKPHASPVLHAINYLLGRLEPRYLETLRQFGGLQSYPSRAKDPDPVDYSTGSVGIGATAPIWGALAHRYVAGHFDVPVGGRQIALLGDAELDEGACWEAIADPMVAKLGEVHVGRRPQPPVARPRGARHRRGPARLDVRGRGLALRDGQVRAEARRARAAAPARRRDAQRGVPAAAARRRGRAAAAGSTWSPTTSTTRSCCTPSATSAATTSARCSTATARPTPCATGPSVVFAYTIKGWRLPTEGHPANHSALLNAEQYAQLAADLGRRPGGPVGDASRTARRRPSCARARRSAWRGRRGRPPPSRRRGARRPRPRAQGHGLDAAGVRALLRRPRARGAGGRRARGHRLARRRHLDQPRRLDQQGRHLVARRPHRLVRRRHRHARALARDRPRPPHRARDRRGQPRRDAGRARRDVVARRPAAAAGRHDLRPVRGARARAVVVRHLRRRPVDPRRHAERRHARPGGRGAPVGDHAVDRHRAARLHVLGAGLRPGPRVDVPARAVAARPRGRRGRVLPALDAADGPVTAQRDARGGAERRLPAAPGRRPARGDRGHGRARARGDRGGRHPARGGRRRGRGRLHHERRPALPLVPGARRGWPRATRRCWSGCSRTTRR